MTWAVTSNFGLQFERQANTLTVLTSNAVKSSRPAPAQRLLNSNHDHHDSIIEQHELEGTTREGARQEGSSKMASNELKTDSPPKVDLVLVFRSGLLQPTSKYTSKQEIKENALAAQAEYERLLSKLKGAGLHATGRRGQKNGQLLVLIWAPSSKIARMVQRERCAFITILSHIATYVVESF